MSGFETSRGTTGTLFRSKQFGSILRGYGPPVPQAGVAGDLYIDNSTLQLFEKRDVDGLDAWGHYLWIVPSSYISALKWFGSSAPDNNLGIVGDYFLQWAGYPNYGMQPMIWGPRGWAGWPENGVGPTVIITGDASSVLQVGLLDEGPSKPDVALNQLIAVGLTSEYVIPLSITANASELVLQLGMQTTGQLITVTVTPNVLYTAEDGHAL